MLSGHGTTASVRRHHGLSHSANGCNPLGGCYATRLVAVSGEVRHSPQVADQAGGECLEGLRAGVSPETAFVITVWFVSTYVCGPCSSILLPREFRPGLRGVISLVRISIENRDMFEINLKRFSKTCQREGIISEIKRREYFEKPSEIKRRQDRERARNIRRIERLRGFLRTSE